MLSERSPGCKPSGAKRSRPRLRGRNCVDSARRYPDVAKPSDAARGVDVVEYLDSQPFVALSRRVASSKAELTDELVL